jgi:putative redox protein
LQQLIEVGEHRLIADAPRSAGGEDSGPGPHDLLAAALGACTALTVLMYARRKTMPLDDVDVTVDHEQAEGEYRFHRRIRYIGTVSDDEKMRLTDIANKCPVHRTLQGQIRIDTSTE